MRRMYGLFDEEWPETELDARVFLLNASKHLLNTGGNDPLFEAREILSEAAWQITIFTTEVAQIQEVA